MIGQDLGRHAEEPLLDLAAMGSHGRARSWARGHGQVVSGPLCPWVCICACVWSVHARHCDLLSLGPLQVEGSPPVLAEYDLFNFRLT